MFARPLKSPLALWRGIGEGAVILMNETEGYKNTVNVKNTDPTPAPRPHPSLGRRTLARQEPLSKGRGELIGAGSHWP